MVALHFKVHTRNLAASRYRGVANLVPTGTKYIGAGSVMSLTPGQ